MIISSVQPTLSENLVAAIVGAFGTPATVDLIATAKIHLFTSMTGSISPTTPVTAFTECSFPGYLSVGFTPTVIGNMPNNQGLAAVSTAEFTANNTITSPGQNAIGYWIDNGSTVMYAAELFASPASFLNPYDFLALTVIIGPRYTNRVT